MSDKLVVGLMSGTSLDGIDAALVRIWESEYTHMELLSFVTVPMDDKLSKCLLEGLDEKNSSNKVLCQLNVKLAYGFSYAVKVACEKANVSVQSLDFIASHGQTIYHISKKSMLESSTLQLGEPAVIAYETGVPVVSNFRAKDIAAGGEGAPLVPFFDFEMFRKYRKNMVLLNIGGIANATFISKTGCIDDVFAFDTGPGNMMINEMMQLLFNQPYDEGGKIAFKGRVSTMVLDQLLTMPFIQEAIPKSTGREVFGRSLCESLLKKYNLSREDWIATISAFTVESIASNIAIWVHSKYLVDEIIISGGGVYNSYIMDNLRLKLKEIPIVISDAYGISADAKEAMAFALLGYRTWTKRSGNVPSATGALSPVILGDITYPD